MQPGSNQLSVTVLVTPDMANLSGNIHSDTLLKYLDEVIYACVSHYAGRYAVALSVDQVVLREPVHVGELTAFLVSVSYTGQASMEAGVKVITGNIREQSARYISSCFFIMVALNNEHKSMAVRPLELETAEQKRRLVQAQ